MADHSHPIHTIMSRLGSFPLRTAYWALQEHGNDPNVVLDPFCGKGTSLLAARMLGSAAYGIDTAPEAVICSRAKLADATLEEISGCLEALRVGKPSTSVVPRDVRTFFHPCTLQQILSIKTALAKLHKNGNKKDREIADVLLATLLGILHGHASYSLSISSAHAFSMSPGYVRRYAREHKLKAPLRDVKACMSKKLARCFAQPLPPRVDSAVVQGNARDSMTIFARLRSRVDCILMSPPYLASHTYAKDNWLRQWLLGYDYRDIGKSYLQTGSITKYADEMKSILASLVYLLRPGGRLICIVGHGRHGSTSEHTINMKDLFTKLLSDRNLQLRLIGVNTECVPSARRYYHALSTTNGHHSHERKEYLLVATRGAS